MVAIALPDPTAQAIMDAHEKAQKDEHRAHLGASLIGHKCDRALWLTFRWVKAKHWTGRMVRLLETGRRAEFRMVEDLRLIGCDVHETDDKGRQFELRDESCGGHFGGSMDGVAQGIPHAAKTWHVLEFKTHSDKSFQDLKAKGVQESKPLHWTQMQVYMGLTGMTRALYMAENKNDSALYTERIHFEKPAFQALQARARRVIEAPEPPPRISENPTWYECKMCDFHEVCHGQAIAEANCRTCAHSTPEMDGDGRWSCAKWQTDLSTTKQREGCKLHRFIPILLERVGDVVEANDDRVTYRKPDGTLFVNGTPDKYSPEVLSSKELHAAGPVPIDAEIAALRAQWGAEIVG